MKYAAIYADLVLSAKQKGRAKRNGEYFESHHIIPRCFGGTNKSDNLVLLTAREHFIAHHLLVKIHQDHAGMRRAFWMMCHSRGNHGHITREYRITSSVYDKARADFSILARDVMLRIRPQMVVSEAGRQSRRQSLLGNKHTLGYKHTETSKVKIREAGTGRKRAPESIAKSVIGATGLRRSTETRIKIGLSKRGVVLSDETKRKISLTNTGRVKTQEHKDKLRTASLGQKSHRYGLHWFNNGEVSVMADECPDGFSRGRKLLRCD